ncbi:hypothetical protein [Hymenobacter jeollabukensis]|uniref:Uncharacterized protein n=1 Tax=Hymenobacter jeollabukensis TaxID=2025313 RepID=A0A5R8WJA6_9BACT|nr:hypothetical protein [Hymenobacter jeollabukensis]TLM88967.1 hypothetical protein FDY95_22560 [Hymenobacter jeollabukensis]
MTTPHSASPTAPGTNRGLILEFQPEDEQVFQREAIRRGRVLLTLVLANGTTLEPSTWRVRRLRPESHLRGNILSRQEFRVGVLDARVTTIRATLLPG